MMMDPVCGMECDPNNSDTMEYRGQTYCFCSPGCREEFEKNPEKYATAQRTGSRTSGQGGYGQGGFGPGGMGEGGGGRSREGGYH